MTRYVRIPSSPAARPLSLVPPDTLRAREANNNICLSESCCCCRRQEARNCQMRLMEWKWRIGKRRKRRAESGGISFFFLSETGIRARADNKFLDSNWETRDAQHLYAANITDDYTFCTTSDAIDVPHSLLGHEAERRDSASSSTPGKI